MLKFFLCNLTDTNSFVAERIYEYHTNILLVALVVIVIVMGGLYFTSFFVVSNITYINYVNNVIFISRTLISLYEKVISSIYLFNLDQKADNLKYKFLISFKSL